MEPADIVLRFLESVGSKRESRFYLDLFRAGAPERFAAISVDANVARHASDAVTLDLRFLAALGLYPVVVLGVFESTEALEHGERFKRRLERSDVRATVIPCSEADHASRAVQAIQASTIPILVFTPDDRGAKNRPRASDDVAPRVEPEPHGEDRFERLARILSALQTRKLLFLHRPGGLRHDGRLIPLVNLTTDYEALRASHELSRKEHALLVQARKLVFERVPHKISISITSPLNLFRELFTIKGAGTLLRRGAVIERREGFGAVDRERLRTLLVASFGRSPLDDFFERPVSCIYLEEAYRGAAIVRETPLGGYLSKFAVDAEAQGEGIARDLWQFMMLAHPVLFWRARKSNPIGDWYERLCDGRVRAEQWSIYWKGLATEKIPAAVAYALEQPIDFP